MNEQNTSTEMQVVLDEQTQIAYRGNIEATIVAMQDNLKHGAEWPVSFFEANLGIKADKVKFSLLMSQLNERLEAEGYHLTTRGKNGTSYWVDALERTSHIVSRMNRQAINYLRRSAVLAHAAAAYHGDKLSDGQRQRLEKQSQIQAMRYVLVSRMR